MRERLYHRPGQYPGADPAGSVLCGVTEKFYGGEYHTVFCDIVKADRKKVKILNAQKTGSLIATIRKEQNRTQQDLANELGVSSAAISKWERGIGFPDVSLIEPLATSLGITIAELFKGEKAENNVDHEYESLLSDVVKVSANEISKKKKITNWIIAITVVILYLLISVISHRWEITWVVWIVYCFYRIFTEYIYKKY